MQEIAKALNIPKFRYLKKLDLVYQILDHQATDPTKVTSVISDDTASTEKPKETVEATTKEKANKPRKRITSEKTNDTVKSIPNSREKNTAEEVKDKEAPKKDTPVNNNNSSNNNDIDNNLPFPHSTSALGYVNVH